MYSDGHLVSGTVKLLHSV